MGSAESGKVTAVGWGLSDRNMIPQNLQEVGLQIIDLDECRATPGFPPLEDSQMCAKEEGRDACSGQNSQSRAGQVRFMLIMCYVCIEPQVLRHEVDQFMQEFPVPIYDLHSDSGVHIYGRDLGDSGGPLIHLGPGCGEADSLVGIVSAGPLCFDDSGRRTFSSLPGIYTKAASFSDWINSLSSDDYIPFSDPTCTKDPPRQIMDDPELLIPDDADVPDLQGICSSRYIRLSSCFIGNPANLPLYSPLYIAQELMIVSYSLCR